MAKKEKSDYLIQAVSNAFDLLESFHGLDEGLQLGEIARRLNKQQGQLTRIISTLESRGYLEQDKLTGQYRVGLKALELSQAYLNQEDLLHRAEGVLRNIVQKCNETAYLAIHEERHIVYTVAAESTQTVRVVSRLGARLPAYCTASGKAHLAFFEDSALEELYSEATLQRFTPQTRTTKRTLRQDFQRILKKGYAVDDREFDPEVCCVAVPVRDYTLAVIGALSVSGPAFRISKKRIRDEIAPLLCSTANELSLALGYPPDAANQAQQHSGERS